MYISAGHSEVDPGAVGRAIDAHGRAVIVTEASIAVEIRNIVSFYLTRAGVKHELDSVGLKNLPLNETVKRTRQLNEIEIEFHCNASNNPTATGCEVLCAPKDNELSAKLCAAIASSLGVRNRGVKAENSGQHSRLAFVRAGGVIVELFFITNPKDLAAYDARKWLVGKAIADVLVAAV